MPVTVQEQREIRQIERELAAQGVEGGISFSKLNEKRQWYRADGTPLPTLLPADDYHVRLFMGKGWTLVPPRGVVVPVAGGPSLIEQELERNRKAAERKGQKHGTLSPIEAEVARETANKEEDDRRRAGGTVAPEAPTVSFLGTVQLPEEAPAPVKGSIELVLACPEPGCPYEAKGKTRKLRESRLQAHTYGPRSKHKKEKQ